MRTIEKSFETNDAAKCCDISEPERVKNFLDYEIMLASHDWKVEYCKEQGGRGLLVSMKCKRCNADRLGVFSLGR